MSFESRVRAFVAAVNHRYPPTEPTLTPAELVEWFDELGREGFFAKEPDFPLAMSELKDALKKWQADGSKDFPEDQDFREAFSWVSRMVNRVEAAKPAPPSVAEVVKLRNWFRANQDRLPTEGGNRTILDLLGKPITHNGFRVTIAGLSIGLQLSIEDGKERPSVAIVRDLMETYGDD